MVSLHRSLNFISQVNIINTQESPIPMRLDLIVFYSLSLVKEVHPFVLFGIILLLKPQTRPQSEIMRITQIPQNVLYV